MTFPTYEQCLAHELSLDGIAFQLQQPQPVEYKGIHLDCGYRIDLLIEDELIIELKAVEEIKGIHAAQLLTYMRLAGIKTGLLINFNVAKLKDGIHLRVLRGNSQNDPILGLGDRLRYSGLELHRTAALAAVQLAFRSSGENDPCS